MSRSEGDHDKRVEEYGSIVTHANTVDRKCQCLDNPDSGQVGSPHQLPKGYSFRGWLCQGGHWCRKQFVYGRIGKLVRPSTRSVDGIEEVIGMSHGPVTGLIDVAKPGNDMFGTRENVSHESNLLRLFFKVILAFAQFPGFSLVPVRNSWRESQRHSSRLGVRSVHTELVNWSLLI